MRVIFNRFMAIFCFVAFSVGAAWAESGPWHVVESSGTVRTTQPMAGVTLVSTGETLVAGAVLATGMDGRVVLVRGEQKIVVGPNSRMSLPAVEEKGMTRIVQDLGTLLFKVDKREKQHFRVETPIIAAVVKGTTFTVTAGASGHSVHVAEGAVEVSALKGNAREMVTAGLTARVTRDNPSVIRMNKSERNGDSSNASERGGHADDVQSDDTTRDDKHAGNLVVPTEVGGEALDFSKLSDGLVRPSDNVALAANTNAGRGNDVAANVRGQGDGATAVQEVRLNSGAISSPENPNRGVGNANANAGGAGNGNANANANSNAGGAGNGNANANANANAGGNGNGNANGNANSNAGGNGNGNANANANSNAGGDGNGNANANANSNAGGNGNGNANANANANAGGAGNGNGGVNVGVDVGEVGVEVGAGQGGVNVGAGLGGINLGGRN